MSRYGYEEDAFVAEFYDFIPGYDARGGNVGFYLDCSRAAAEHLLHLGRKARDA